MKFYCSHCKKTINRDMRLKENKNSITKRGFKTWCNEFWGIVYLKKIK